MAKVTQAEIDDLKKAKKALEDLQHEMSGSGGAQNYLNAVTSTGTAFGALDGNGQKIAEFITARHQAVSRALVEKATPGVGAAIMMLQTTITNYENNENTNRAAAEATPAGKSRMDGSSGGPQQGMG